MKTAKITLLTMIWISGICLAGNEAETITQQFIAGMTGLMLFAWSSWAIVKTLRG